MKNIKLILVFVFLFFITNNVYASINTYTRDENNLMVPSDVRVTDENKNDILKTPAVSAKEKVYDYADLYTDEEEKELFSIISHYIGSSEYDSALVTTKDFMVHLLMFLRK